MQLVVHVVLLGVGVPVRPEFEFHLRLQTGEHPIAPITQYITKCTEIAATFTGWKWPAPAHLAHFSHSNQKITNRNPHPLESRLRVLP